MTTGCVEYNTNAIDKKTEEKQSEINDMKQETKKIFVKRQFQYSSLKGPETVHRLIHRMELYVKV